MKEIMNEWTKTTEDWESGTGILIYMEGEREREIIEIFVLIKFTHSCIDVLLGFLKTI